MNHLNPAQTQPSSANLQTICKITGPRFGVSVNSSSRPYPRALREIHESCFVSQPLGGLVFYELKLVKRVFRSALLLPSILRRIDEYLLVKELNAKLFDNWLDEKPMLEALTTPSANAECDYERLELLG